MKCYHRQLIATFSDHASAIASPLTDIRTLYWKTVMTVYIWVINAVRWISLIQLNSCQKRQVSRHSWFHTMVMSTSGLFEFDIWRLTPRSLDSSMSPISKLLLEREGCVCFWSRLNDTLRLTPRSLDSCRLCYTSVLVTPDSLSNIGSWSHMRRLYKSFKVHCILLMSCNRHQIIPWSYEYQRASWNVIIDSWSLRFQTTHQP